MIEDEMVGWHHWLDTHEFEQDLGVGDGQGGLMCCSPWSHNESDMTEWLNWIDGTYHLPWASQVVLVIKNLPTSVRDITDTSLIPWRRAQQSTPYSCWRIPWAEESGRLQSIESQRVKQNWSDLNLHHTIYSLLHLLLVSFLHLLPPSEMEAS